MRKLRKRLLTAVLTAGLLGTAQAKGATTTLSIVIISSPSTALTCTPAPLTAPVAAGTTVCALAITPAVWAGTLALSGTNASLFALSGTNLVVGSAGIPSPGSYSVTLTATP